MKRILFALCGLVLSAGTVLANEDYEHLYNDPVAQREFIETKIHEYFPEPGLAEAIIELANCESTNLIHWMPDGTLRPQEKSLSSARGVLQILAGLHGPDMTLMGLRIDDIDDYMTFARHLYDTQGPGAWEQCVVKMTPTVVATLYEHN